jgi:hypothetical protein
MIGRPASAIESTLQRRVRRCQRILIQICYWRTTGGTGLRCNQLADLSLSSSVKSKGALHYFECTVSGDLSVGPTADEDTLVLGGINAPRGAR